MAATATREVRRDILEPFQLLLDPLLALPGSADHPCTPPFHACAPLPSAPQKTAAAPSAPTLAQPARPSAQPQFTTPTGQPFNTTSSTNGSGSTATAQRALLVILHGKRVEDGLLRNALQELKQSEHKVREHSKGECALHAARNAQERPHSHAMRARPTYTHLSLVQVTVRVTFDRGDVERFVAEAVRLNDAGAAQYETIVAGEVTAAATATVGPPALNALLLHCPYPSLSNARVCGCCGMRFCSTHARLLLRHPCPTSLPLPAGGGDGTLNEVVGALMQHREAIVRQGLSVALLPLGTANDFAATAGISVVSPVDAAPLSHYCCCWCCSGFCKQQQSSLQGAGFHSQAAL
jgi:hypothetical protein